MKQNKFSMSCNKPTRHDRISHYYHLHQLSNSPTTEHRRLYYFTQQQPRMKVLIIYTNIKLYSSVVSIIIPRLKIIGLSMSECKQLLIVIGGWGGGGVHIIQCKRVCSCKTAGQMIHSQNPHLITTKHTVFDFFLHMFTIILLVDKA